MIRKTVDNNIEEFSVEGGRVIDDDGTWAFQIPMNLDYKVTDEFGNLIPSQDPNKGVATSASVRFKINMDETGGEGRLRTRASYLVPNNPQNPSEVDYTFDQSTKSTSFRKLEWNKIYSVSNFIPRFQKQVNVIPNPAKARGFTGVKDVDACAGDKTPFPYNKVNTELNPIFFIICLIIKIMAFLISIMNFIIIPLINIMIKVINAIMNAIVNVVCGIVDAINSVSSLLGLNLNCGLSWTDIEYIPCIAIQCPSDNGKFYAPGCMAGDSKNAADAKYGTVQGGANSGLDDCIAFEMAKALNIFQLDFYNDWVNGTLFSFLLKYKKKKRHTEKFCEYDCKDFGGGVDTNNNGVPDNHCRNSLLLDTCYNSGSNSQNESRQILIRDGLIKKVGDEFFYAATAHQTNVLLFATDIINLGSVFECDWQGIPKVQQYLIPTTYQIPPDIEEIDDNLTQVEVTGMIHTRAGQTTNGLFFDINCVGVHVDYRQCLNIRHICEFGVGLDEAVIDPSTGNVLSSPDAIIGVNDIDDDNGQYFRDVFYELNTPNAILGPHTTNFNLSNAGVYNFANATDNGQDYSSFRGYISDDTFSQPKHSYFFYFGLLPGKTGLDKMNQRFFTHCKAIVRDDFIIQATATPTTTNNSIGTISFTIIGGHGPYNYTITGLNYQTTGTANPSGSVSGLGVGTYTITATDSLGSTASQIVVVSGPLPLYSIASVTKNASSIGATDGQITISSVAGGTGPYTYVVTTYSGSIVGGPAPLTAPLIINGLGVDTTHGYVVTVTDSLGATSVTNGLTISGPNTITVTSTNTDVTCYGGNDGAITLNITGGQAPFNISTTSAGFSSSNQVMSGLVKGLYVTTITDMLGNTATISNNLVELNGQMTIALASTSELAKQCDPTTTKIPFYITQGASAGPIDVEYSIDGGSFVTTSMVYVNPSTPLVLTISTNISSRVNIRFKNPNGCLSNQINIAKASIALPSSVLTASITRSGPVSGNYTYVVSGSGGIGSITGTGTFVSASPTYTATITDSVGCTATASI
jgi:hypothetical protein